MKKALVFALVLAATAGSLWANGSKLMGIPEEDETARLEVCVADSLFTNGVASGNNTELNFKASFVNNRYGFLLGTFLRETLADGSGTTGGGLSFTANLGFVGGVTVFNNELLGGYMFLPDFSAGSPYVSYRYCFNLFPTKTGNSHNMDIRLGLEWYLDVLDGDSDPMANLGTLLYSMFFPKLTVGVSYRFSHGFVKKTMVEAPDVTVPVAPIIELQEDEEASTLPAPVAPFSE